jgi:hypothetical protein
MSGSLAADDPRLPRASVARSRRADPGRVRHPRSGETGRDRALGSVAAGRTVLRNDRRQAVHPQRQSARPAGSPRLDRLCRPSPPPARRLRTLRRNQPWADEKEDWLPFHQRPNALRCCQGPEFRKRDGWRAFATESCQVVFSFHSPNGTARFGAAWERALVRDQGAVVAVLIVE